ncbi:TIGR03857 family LLM class F420-dependent oxidoreductase [Actinomycetospora chibensis]|uniref:TIGR03857 family LLM class F420-dependent oxidoreductase n=1 Tax=Actinomycetospora chibensis TaxID=663606 RepID=A0ABV9RD00_9PSEU|nr:TIGR03857 family LLM class F420-dependent oxidoreductase [Actinomycetospora chibensis]MDD7925090.1 TIGR03857 family LLM class F420-dependent oxidoreductase [Actinomycetospora chibensis]
MNPENPVVDDLSAYLVSGRVRSHAPAETAHLTATRTPAQGVEDGVEAERLGFRRVFLSERWNLKEAGVLLGAVGARTTRIGLGTGLISPARRHVLHTAALGATMQATFGPRFVLGLGRGDHSYLRSEGLRTASYAGLRDYVDILRRLWRGETVDHDGPAGHHENIRLGDAYDGPPPEIWFGTFALPVAARTVAASFDGVLLPPVMTPDATRAAVARLREACKRADRDPATLRICQCVITAPDLDDEETRAVAHARAVTYLQAPEFGDALLRANDWDREPAERLRSHPMFRGHGEIADVNFHRTELAEPARLVPDAWMQEAGALGSTADCVETLARFRDAGADEIATYGSTPGQNAALLGAWRERRALLPT